MDLFNKDSFTIGDFISAVMAIDNELDAEAFAADYESWSAKNHPKNNATEVMRSNIGWCFGEGMDKERQKMWVKVCGASHPVFGQATPTAEEAFEAGRKLGESIKGEKT